MYTIINNSISITVIINNLVATATVSNMSLFTYNKDAGTKRINPSSVTPYGTSGTRWRAVFVVTSIPYGFTSFYVTVESGDNLDANNVSLTKAATGSLFRVWDNSVVSDAPGWDGGPAPRTVTQPIWSVDVHLKAGDTTAYTLLNTTMFMKKNGVETTMSPTTVVLPTSIDSGYMTFNFNGGAIGDAKGNYSYRVMYASNSDLDASGVQLTLVRRGSFRIVDPVVSAIVIGA